MTKLQSYSLLGALLLLNVLMLWVFLLQRQEEEAAKIPILSAATISYRACKELADINPIKALEQAKAWREKDPDYGVAIHCEALAHYGMRDFEEAAVALEALAKDTEAQGKTHLAAIMWIQATRARKERSRDLPLARKDIDQALALEPENATAKALLAEIPANLVIPAPTK